MITQLIEDFKFNYYNPTTDTIEQGDTTSWQNKRTILFFYPADCTTVCPTELEDLAKYDLHFKNFNEAQLYTISTDSGETHKEWIKNTESLHKFPYPMISDRTHQISEYFGVYNTDTGNARRATIIINPHKVIVSCDIVIDEIGRWTKELIRRLAALEQNFDHKDTMCPSSREPGEKTLINPNWATFKSEDFFL